MSLRSKALIAIFIAALLWSSSATIPKLLFLEAPPFTVAFERFAIAALIIFPFMLHSRKPKRFFETLLPLGIFNGLNIICYYAGVSLTTANSASILGPTVPLVVAVIAYLFIGESVSKQKALGIIIGLTGALCIILLPLFSGESFASGSLLGNLLLIGSTCSWSFYIMFSRRLLAKGNFSPLVSTSVNIVVTTVLTGVAAILFKQPLITPALTHTSFLAMLLFTSIGLTLITFFLFQWAVQHVSAVTASLKEYIQLVFGIIINTIVLGEQFTVAYVIGGVLIIVGVFIATREHLTRQSVAAFAQQE